MNLLSRSIGNASAAVFFAVLLLFATDLLAGEDASPTPPALKSVNQPAHSSVAASASKSAILPSIVPAVTTTSPASGKLSEMTGPLPNSSKTANEPLLTITYNSRTLAPFEATSQYSGEVFTEDTHWQGLIRLDGWVTVSPQATLTIHPQTVVRIAANGGIHVLGRIVVKGSKESPVLLSSLFVEPAQADWRGIVLSGTEKKNSFEHVRIEGADNALFARLSSFSAKNFTISRTTAAIQLQDAVVTLADGRISACSKGLAAVNSEIVLTAVALDGNRTGMTLESSSTYGADVSMTGNRFFGLVADQSQLKLDRFSVAGSDTGTKIAKCEGSIVNSVFRDNREAGLTISGSRVKMTGNLFTANRIGLQVDDNLPVLWGNSLHNNRSYNLLYLGSESFFAGGNWFGPTGAEAVEKTVFSKRPGAAITEPLLTDDPVPVD